MSTDYPALPPLDSLPPAAGAGAAVIVVAAEKKQRKKKAAIKKPIKRNTIISVRKFKSIMKRIGQEYGIKMYSASFGLGTQKLVEFRVMKVLGVAVGLANHQNVRKEGNKLFARDPLDETPAAVRLVRADVEAAAKLLR